MSSNIKENLKKIYKVDITNDQEIEIDNILYKYCSNGLIPVRYRPLSSIEAFMNKITTSSELDFDIRRGDEYYFDIEEVLYIANDSGITKSRGLTVSIDGKDVCDNVMLSTGTGDGEIAKTNVALVLSISGKKGFPPSTQLFIYILNTNLSVGPSNIIFEDIPEGEDA